jgi:zinc transport system permease protein
MLELLELHFFQRALIVGLILGILMALLGVLVVLRRLSFFADAIGHSALTGIALGLLLQFNPFITALLFAVAVAAGITLVKRFSKLPIDTLLGIAFPAAVAVGVILVRLTPGYQTDLIAFLFGDILTVNNSDVILSIGLALVTVTLLVLSGKALITIAVDESLAQAEGVAVIWYELLLLMLLAGVIALAIKLVGIVLVTAMLVTPAASAQNIAWSLSTMFIFSAVISVVAVSVGMLMSAWLNVPSGPAIVLAAAVCFVLSLLFKPLKTTAV